MRIVKVMYVMKEKGEKQKGKSVPPGSI